MENGKILVFDDFVNAYKEQDAGAFVVDDDTEAGKPKPTFSGKTTPTPDEPTPEHENKDRPLIW